MAKITAKKAVINKPEGNTPGQEEIIIILQNKATKAKEKVVLLSD